MHGQDTFKDDLKLTLQFHTSSHAPDTSSQFLSYFEEISAINYKASVQ